MNKIYLLLGSNQQQPLQQLQLAKKIISKKVGTVGRQSAVYKTAAWGNTKQPDFLNQVLVVTTTFAATEVIDILLEIEKAMGRIRTKKNAPRIIDIDILFFNKEVVSTKKLQVPHPRLHLRNFVLIPLNQLSPNLKHPVLQKTINQLLKICPDNLTVNKI